MQACVALLRAVNVSGTGKLPMADLKRMGEECGLEGVSTYIASGNLLFRTSSGEGAVVHALGERLHAYFGKPVSVFLRTAGEMSAIAACNPFPDEPGNRVMVNFLAEPPPDDTVTRARNVDGEAIALGKREIYVAYGEGIGTSRLVLPAAKSGTARNMNTVRKLAALLEAIT